MTRINKEMIGEPVSYKGHIIVARRHDENIMACVDGVALDGFHLTPEAARFRGMRHVDDKKIRRVRYANL